MSKRTILAAIVVVAGAAAGVHAGGAPTGVQWTPDTDFILVNKDVGNERWAITLNLANLHATGNVFFSTGESPSFIWCDHTGEDFDGNAGELDLFYSCFGAERGFGGFASSDWNLVDDGIVLPLSFFIPEAETCDLAGALNGPNQDDATSFWTCGGSEGTFDFQIFANGTGISSATGEFAFDAFNEGCRFAQLGDGSLLDVEYSPSRDMITIFEVPNPTESVIVSECEREDL